MGPDLDEPADSSDTPRSVDPSSGFGPNLSEQELLFIIEKDGWREIECDLFLGKEMTLTDLRRLIEEELSRG